MIYKDIKKCPIVSNANEKLEMLANILKLPEMGQEWLILNVVFVELKSVVLFLKMSELETEFVEEEVVLENQLVVSLEDSPVDFYLFKCPQ
jgi:hypothetical protein